MKLLVIRREKTVLRLLTTERQFKLVRYELRNLIAPSLVGF
jgi:hypothetical protein